MSFEDINQKVAAALKKLRNQDPFLIDANTNERTISHKLAEYLQREFPGRNVDCEYNRHGTEKKEVDMPRNNISWNDIEARTIFPDIIVHERNSDNHNLLVIEVKKSSNVESRQLDKNKLMALTKEPYCYSFGLFLEISMNHTADFLQGYAKGEMSHEERIPVEAN